MLNYRLFVQRINIARKQFDDNDEKIFFNNYKCLYIYL